MGNGKLVDVFQNYSKDKVFKPVISSKYGPEEGIIIKVVPENEYLYKGLFNNLTNRPEPVVEEACCICQTLPPNVLNVPCYHQALCSICLKEEPKANKNCPICREKVMMMKTMYELNDD